MTKSGQSVKLNRGRLFRDKKLICNIFFVLIMHAKVSQVNRGQIKRNESQSETQDNRCLLLLMAR